MKGQLSANRLSPAHAHGYALFALALCLTIAALLGARHATVHGQTTTQQPERQSVPRPQLPPGFGAQFNCGTSEPPPSSSKTTASCSKQLSAYKTKYGRASYHVPDANTPVKTILVNFNVMQKSDGTGNYANTPDQIAGFHQVIEWLNGSLRWNKLPSDPINGVQYIEDTKIRFELHGVYFYQNDGLWSSNSAPALLNAAKAVDPSRLEQLNIFFTEGWYFNKPNDPNDTVSGFSVFPLDFNFNLDSYVVMFRFSQQGTNLPTPDNNYTITGTLLHELGHALDLHHTYDGAPCNQSDPDYLDDVFGSGASAVCPHIVDWGCNASDPNLPNSAKCTNNMMGGNKDAGYFSPKQLGRIHRALALKSVRRYVKDCPKSTLPLAITSDEAWDFDMKLYSDVVVKNGATLTLQCTTTLPGAASLTTSGGGQVIYDGGQVLNECNTYGPVVALTPKWSSHFTNTQACVTAKVSDQAGAPLVGKPVKFDVVGVNPTGGWAVTDANGIATFCFIGQVIKYDYVTATVGQSQTATTSDTATVQWTSQSDLFITKTGTPNIAQYQGLITYTITVKNLGPSHATGVKVTEKLPQWTTLKGASLPFTQTGNDLTFSLGFLPNTSTAVITVKLQPDIAGTMVNQALVSGSQFDPNTANNQATAITQVDPPACFTLPTNALGWWMGDGNALTSTGWYHGTLMNGATATAPGLIKQAFGLDGINDYVDLGGGFAPNALTLEAWVYIDASAPQSPTQRVISKDNYQQAGTRKMFTLKSRKGAAGPAFEVLIGADFDRAESATPLSTGWHHLAGVRDTAAGRFELYIDGVLVNSQVPKAIGAIDSSVNTVLGRVSPFSSSESFYGRIDDTAIYGRALTAAEIKTIFLTGKGGKCPPTCAICT